MSNVINRSISIHALLAESDVSLPRYHAVGVLFLSTLSLRRATIISQHSAPDNGNFYPRSPCGERPLYPSKYCISMAFLSTLSLRRATSLIDHFRRHNGISIHALLAESDLRRGEWRRGSGFNFYPRSPCGERLAPLSEDLSAIISIHALLAESDYCPL